MLHEICLVIIMQMDSEAASVDLHYIPSALSVIDNASPGAKRSSVIEETE